ncbi:F0F1 ATP synthase subunit delta [Geminicoccus harenae]|uniref:F0F1 ATP synthase subunit delta n=1 Tax=Geminicoccus harenae TaxID=2498453 RepID=UPI00168A76A0|nr:F0F1 ATP synthase subunit delta [Geminicoccus harenae]
MSARTATSSGLAARYAQAMFELASEQGALDQVGTDLDKLDRAIAESPDLARLIASPVVTREQHASAVSAVADELDLSEITRKFLGVLAAKRRLFALPSIVSSFRARLAEQRGEVTAEVASAQPLDQKQLAALTDAVTAYSGKKVRLDTKVDPSLIGGLVVTVGSRQVDASLKRKLQQLDVAMRGLG